MMNQVVVLDGIAFDMSVLEWMRRLHAKNVRAPDMLIGLTLQATSTDYALTSERIIELTGLKRTIVADGLRRLKWHKLIDFAPNPLHVGRGKSLVFYRINPPSGDSDDAKEANTRKGNSAARE